MGRQCIAAVPKPRKRRSTSALSETDTGRVSVSNLLSSTPEHPATPTATSYAAAPAQSFSAPKPRQPDAYREALPAQVDKPFDARPPFTSLFAERLGLSDIESRPRDLLNGTSQHVVHDCVTAFCSLQQTTPFIQITPTSDPYEMVSRRPITTLAICAVTLTSYSDKQDRICDALKRALIGRRATNSEPNMDEAAGLLIYLSWAHRTRPGHSFYCDLHQLAALATEVGRSGRLDYETQRLLLGCYYFCSTLTSSDASRPNPFPWTQDLGRLAEQFSRSSQNAQDRMLVLLIELARSSEELSTSLREASSDNARNLQVAAIDMYVTASRQSLASLARVDPDFALSLPARATRVYIQAQALRSAPPNDTSTILEAAHSIKNIVEMVLSLPPAFMHQASITDWTPLLAALAFMVSLFTPSTSPTASWAAAPLHSAIQPIKVLDALANHMSSVPYNERNERFTRWFSDLTEALKARLNREGRRVSGESAGGFRPVNQSQSPPAPASLSRMQSGSVVDPFGVFKPELLEDAFWDRVLNQ